MLWLPSSTRTPPTSSSSTLRMTLMWRQHRFWMYRCQCARGVCRCRVARRMCSSPQSTCGSTSTCTGLSWPTSLLYRWGTGGLGFHFQRLLSPVISSFASYIVGWSGFETGVSGMVWVWNWCVWHGNKPWANYYLHALCFWCRSWVVESPCFCNRRFYSRFFTVFFLVRDSVNTKTFNRHVCIHVLQLL